MNDVSAAKPSEVSISRLVGALLFANFVIGSGVMAVPGLLNLIAADLSVSISKAGQLVALAAVVMCLGAPLLAAITSQMDRRRLLVGAMLVYAFGHLACALSPNFAWLLPVRAVSVISAALVTPQAAATLGLVVPPAKRAAALTAIFLGWSVASVIGIPLASLVGAHFGWRSAFVGLSVLSLLATAGLVWTLPRGLFIPALSLKAWQRVVTHPVLMTVLAVTLLSASGQFTVFAYVAPMLEHTVGAAGVVLAALLGWNGAFGVLGNVVISRSITRLGADRAVALTLASMIVAQVIWGVAMLWSAAAWPLLLLALTAWGLGIFASNSSQQARLMAAEPSLASASIALNTSAIYGGQAVGATMGGVILQAYGFAWLPWAAACLLTIAWWVSWRMRRHTPAAHFAPKAGA